MLKIKFAQYAHKHKQAKQAKSQIVKAYKIAESLSGFYANIQLTGIYEIDYKTIRPYLSQEYTKLAERITQDIADDQEYNHGYSFGSKLIILNFLVALEKALSIMGDYPEIPVKTIEFEFQGESIEAKYAEARKYFDENPIHGYNQEWFSVQGENKRRLFTWFFVIEDLADTDKLIVTYQ